MQELNQWISDYLHYCHYQKDLDQKTIKAYRIDLKQFLAYMWGTDGTLSKQNLTNYRTFLHQRYQPKSIKRKIASLRAFINYLVYEEIIRENPLNRMKIKSNEPFILPRTIPFSVIEALLSFVYQRKANPALTYFQHGVILRDIAILETLFATGMRVSELCSLKAADVDLLEGTIKIFGKGAKERIIQIGNLDVLSALKEYKDTFSQSIQATGSFFVNRLHNQISDQSVRMMINKYTSWAGLNLHITPHMFRHSFATLLLEEDVDIRYIQKFLGHSSIVTTQIYTHVASKKQRDILSLKHPRNKISV